MHTHDQLDQSLTYRYDIEGLRAVAVVSVVLFHLNPRLLPGGFAGVDVFFVISGYLITSHLLRDSRSQKYSLGELITRFYEKRAKRIIPASLFMISISLLAGWFFLTPTNYSELAESAFFSAFGLANFYFYNHTDYFAQSSELLPLLHMWSLGVEEQFYFIWPVVIFFLVANLRMTPSAICFAILAVIASSFWMSHVVMQSNSAAAFYLPWFRAWELGAGALMVFLPRINNKAASELTAGAGVLLILCTIYFLEGGETALGPQMVPAVLGAALVVWPKKKSLASVLLAFGPVAFFGKISYSLYLWHWPVIVFFKHYSFGLSPNVIDSSILIFLMISLAYVSWRYVEKPTRSLNFSPFKTLSLSAFGMVIVAGMGILIKWDDGIPQRFPLEAQKFLALSFYGKEKNIFDCGISSVEKAKNGMACIAKAKGKQKILLIGDSYAAHLLPGLRNSFPNTHITRIVASGCRPILKPKGNPACVSLMQHAMTTYVKDGNFDKIILAGRWLAGDWTSLKETVIFLSPFGKVYVIGQPAEYTTSVPELLLSTFLIRRIFDVDEYSLVEDVKIIETKMKSELAETSGTFISSLDTMCDAKNCRILTQKGTPIQFDYGHLTTDGSLEVVSRMKENGLLR